MQENTQSSQFIPVSSRRRVHTFHVILKQTACLNKLLMIAALIITALLQACTELRLKDLDYSLIGAT